MPLPPLIILALRRLRAVLALAFVALVSIACATPTSRLRDFASERGLERRTLVAGGFALTVFENAAFGDVASSGVPFDEGASGATFGDEANAPRVLHAPAAALPHEPIRRRSGESRTRSQGPATGDEPARTRSSALHVYLEGDGMPWMYRVIVTPDPTPRRPLMLGLMTLDETPAVYVGRPCYNGTSHASGCDDALWTSARYSATVVDSMAEAIRSIAGRGGYPTVRLFGHSGGGMVALLLAARLEHVVDVVTVAGNLDTAAWTRHHGYSPLRESMNPASEPALDPGVHQWHLVGGRDHVVPPSLARPFVARTASATGVLFPSFTHGCCWSRIWPGVLRAVAADDPARLPGTVFQEGGGDEPSGGVRPSRARSILPG